MTTARTDGRQTTPAPPRALLLLLGALLLLALGCGRVGDPIPPDHARIGPPTGVTLVGFGDTLTLSWSAPNTTVMGKKVLPASAYLIDRTVWEPGEDPCRDCPDQPGDILRIDGALLRAKGLPDTLYNDKDLLPGWTYRYTVTAVDHQGRVGEAAAPVSTTWFALPPPVVEILPEDHGALVRYRPPQPLPKEVATGILEEQGLAVYDQAGGLVLQVPAASGDGHIHGLANNESASFAARWVVTCAEGWLMQSAPVTLRVTPYDLTAPAPPAEIVLLTEPGAVILNWLPPRDEDYTAVVIERRVGEGGWTLLAELEGHVLRYEDRACPAGAVCRYRITAVDQVGNYSAPSAVSETRGVAAHPERSRP